MKNHQKDDCRRILDYYGDDKQEIQTAQELMELGILLTHRPDQRGENHRYYILGEMADVEIMLEQMKQAYNISEEELERAIDRKLNRQKRRMSDERIKKK